jgi:hypothetical protein
MPDQPLPPPPLRAYAYSRQQKKPRWWVWDETNQCFLFFESKDFIQQREPHELRIAAHPQTTRRPWN